MLQIPILPTQLKQKSIPPRAAQQAAAAPEAAETLEVRRELAEALSGAETVKSRLEILGAWLKKHAGMLPVSPALEGDVELVSKSCEMQLLNAQVRRAQDQLAQEEETIVAVSQQAASAELLDGYLQTQFRVYTEHLQAQAVAPDLIKQRLARLRRRCLSGACLHALETENLPLACEILSRWEKEFSVQFIRACTLKIAWSFAQEQARALWENACQDVPYDAEEVFNRATAANVETQPLLRRKITEILQGYKAVALRQQAQAQAELLTQLAAGSSQQAFDLLRRTSGHGPALLEKCYRVCLALERSAAIQNPALFIKLYVAGTKDALEQAYQREQLSAREYLQLLAVYYLRQAGADDFIRLVYVKKLEQVLKKETYLASQAARFEYELLTAPDPQDAWEKITQLIKGV